MSRYYIRQRHTGNRTSYNDRNIWISCLRKPDRRQRSCLLGMSSWTKCCREITFKGKGIDDIECQEYGHYGGSQTIVGWRSGWTVSFRDSESTQILKEWSKEGLTEGKMEMKVERKSLYLNRRELSNVQGSILNSDYRFSHLLQIIY